MRRFAMIALLAATGCASSGPSPAASPEPVRVTLGSGVSMAATVTPMEGVAAGGLVAASPDRVWAVLRAVYDSLGIPVATMDASTRSIGNTGLRLKRRLGEVALSKYVNCGNTQGFSSADTYEVFLSVLTSATADASGGTMVKTTVDGQARPITIAGELVRCRTLATLEARIVAVAKALATP